MFLCVISDPLAAQFEWYTKELQSEREQREDATTAVMKLQEVITDVTGEMEEATHAAGSAHKELGVERKARMKAEEAVITLRSQLESMQSVMQNFRSEMSMMKERSQLALSSVQEKRDDIDKVRSEAAVSPSNPLLPSQPPALP